MMTSSYGSIFRVTSPLWGETTDHRWIPLTKASDADIWCFLWSTPEQTVERTIETLEVWNTVVLIMMSLWCRSFVATVSSTDITGNCLLQPRQSLSPRDQLGTAANAVLYKEHNQDTGPLCWEPPVNYGIPAQRASNAKSAFMSWRYDTLAPRDPLSHFVIPPSVRRAAEIDSDAERCYCLFMVTSLEC